VSTLVFVGRGCSISSGPNASNWPSSGTSTRLEAALVSTWGEKVAAEVLTNRPRRLDGPAGHDLQFDPDVTLIKKASVASRPTLRRTAISYPRAPSAE